jgi:hypothetical protein
VRRTAGRSWMRGALCFCLLLFWTNICNGVGL